MPEQPKNPERNLRQDHKTKIPLGQDFPYVLGIILLTLLACFPLFSDRLFITHDTTSPITRLISVYNFIGDGQILTRWVPNMSFGYGRPLFNFYPPLFSYIGSLFSLSGSDIVSAFNAASILLWLSSGLAMYLFAKEFFGRPGGFISALAYVFAPYHIVDIYVRGAVAEFSSFVFFPLILWSLYKSAANLKPAYFIVSSLSIGLLFLSHNLMSLIFTPVMFLYMAFLYVIGGENKNKALALNIASFLLGISLSAFFWLPAFLEKKLVNIDYMFEGYYSHSVHFVKLPQLIYSKWGYGPSVAGPDDEMSFQIGFFHLTTLFLVPLFLRRFLKKSPGQTLQILFFLILGTISVYFTTEYSSVFWQILPLIKFLQFPWRILSIVVFALSFISGGLFLIVQRKSHQKFLLIFLTLGIIITSVFYCRADRYYPFMGRNTLLYLTDKNNRNLPIRNRYVGDYTPKWVKAVPVPPQPQQLVVIEGDAQVLRNEHSSITHLFTLNAQTDSILRFNTFYYPGWKAFIDGREAEINPNNPHGLIDFSVPKGRHEIKIAFGHTPLRAFATTLSLLALIFLLALTFKFVILPLLQTPIQNGLSVLQESSIPRSLPAWVAPGSLLLIPLVIYLSTLCPTIYDAHSAQFTQAVARWDIPRANSFPIYLISAKIFSHLFPFGDIAFKLNLFSAIFASLTCWGLYRVMITIGYGQIFAWASALCLAVSTPLWSHATVAGPQTMAMFLFAIFLNFLFQRLTNHSDKLLYLIALSFGLGVGTHPAVLLTIPAAFYFFKSTEEDLTSRPSAVKALFIATSIIILAYLFFPIKSALSPEIGPHLPATSAELMTNPALSRIPPAHARAVIIILLTTLRNFILEFTPLGILLIFLGIRFLWNQKRPILATISLILLAHVVYLVSTRDLDLVPRLGQELFPSVLILTLWLAGGFQALSELFPSRVRRLGNYILIGLIFPLTCFVLHYPIHNRRGNYIALDYANNVLKSLPPRSILFVNAPALAPLIEYQYYVPRVREDIVLIHEKRLSDNLYCQRLIKERPDVIPPQIRAMPVPQRVPYLISANIGKKELFTTFMPQGPYELGPFGLVLKIASKNSVPEFKTIKESNQALWNNFSLRGLPVSPLKNLSQKEIVQEYSLTQSDLGLYYLSNQDMALGLKTLQSALLFDANNFHALYNLGRYYGGSGDVSKGYDFMERAFEADPPLFLQNIPYGGGAVDENLIQSEYYNQNGLHHMTIHNYDKAVEFFKKAIEANPKNISNYVLLGDTYKKMGDSKHVIESYAQAIAVSPGSESTIAYLNLGMFYYRALNDPLKAREYLEQYLEFALKGKQSPETRKQIREVEDILQKIAK